MNDLDTRIRQALWAQAEQLTEADLTPMQPPHGSGSGWRLPILVAAAVVLLAAGGTVAIRAAGHAGSRHPAPPAASKPVPSSARPSPSGVLPSSSPAPNTSGKSGPPASVKPTPQLTGMPPLPLWPLTLDGRGSPAGTAQNTALTFTRQYLGFTDITTVTSSRFDGQGAHIGVGYRNPAGRLVTAAVLHLVRYGGGLAWEVAGTDDTTLSLEQPPNGTTVTSPMTVGGHITGVDENVRVVIRSQAHDGAVAGWATVPTGGQHTRWHTTVSSTDLGLLIVVASTGGHLQAVERFAVEGVYH